MSARALDVHLRVLGLPLLVRCSSVELGELVQRLWSPFLSAPEPAADACWHLSPERLLRGGAELARGAQQAVLARLAQDLNEQVLTRAGLPLAVHAGCVTDGRRTLAWPAASTVGKSTFTAAALEAGWRYVTDEGVVLQEGTTVVPYPRPLGLCGVARERYATPDSLRLGEDVLVPPADLRAVAVGERPQLTDVLLLERRPGASGLVLSPVPRVELVPVLLQRSFNAFRDPGAAVGRFAEVARSVRVWRAVYGDAWDAAPLLSRALEEAG